MKEFIALATVYYYNDIEVKTEVEKIVLTEVEDFVDAMSRIEKYYSKDLERADIEIFEGPFVALSDKAYAAIKEVGVI